MSPWLSRTLLGLGILVGAIVLDRLLRAAEDRGWIYYRKHKPSGASFVAALFQIQAIFQPEKQHIIEQKREIKEDGDADGGEGPELMKRIPPRLD
jgi:hypothetical protein